MSQNQTHILTFAVEPFEPEKPGPVRFRGVAYSGGLIPQYGMYGDSVIDLASINLPEKIFALVDHDTGERAGMCFPRLEDNQIIVEGVLFDTEAGREVAELLKAGAPWQMSVGIQAKTKVVKTYEEINGQFFEFIDTVFSDASLREVSFVAVGADPNTAVSAFAKRDGHQPQGATPMELEALKAKVAELEAANADLKSKAEEAQAELSAIKLAARKDAIAKLEVATGQTFDDAKKSAFASMDDAQFEAVSITLSAIAKPAAPDHLFSEQATGGKPSEPSEPVLLSASAIYAKLNKGA